MLETAPPLSATASPGRAELATPPPAAAPSVTAILVVRGEAPRLSDCLDALGASITPPDRLLVLDLGMTGDARGLVLG
ncbi:MAG: hypothetical protein WCG47_11350, partial [Dermatophilaceae bacterium]